MLDVMVWLCGVYVCVFGLLKVIECVVEVVRNAKARGKRVVVASSGVKMIVFEYFEYYGLLDLFEVVVMCEDVMCGKFVLDLYVFAVEKLGVAFERCCAYEDVVFGVESVCVVGYKCVVDVCVMFGYYLMDYLCLNEL